MKKNYIALCVLIVLSFIVTGVFLVFMPDEVPMHYNIQGDVDRLGSKYENLILPAITLILGASAIFAAKRRGTMGDAAMERLFLIVGIAVTVLMNLLSVYVMCKAMSYTSNESSVITRIDPMKPVTIGLAALIAVLGYLMPSAPMNRAFGLRTKWSMKNPRVWAKCQRFGGRSALVCAALMALAGILLSGAAAFAAAVIIVVMWSAVCVFACKSIYENDDRSDS